MTEQSQINIEKQQHDSVSKNKVLMPLLRVTFSLVILFLIFRAVDINEVKNVIAATQYQWLLLALVFQILSTLLAGYRWSLVMAIMNFVDDVSFYIKSYFKGSFFNQGLPTSIGGDAIRVLDVAATGHRKRDAFTGVFVDRLLGLTGLLIMTLIASLANPTLLPEGLFLVINLIVLGGLAAFMTVLFFYKLALFERWRLGRYLIRTSQQLMRVMCGFKNSSIQMGLGIIIHLLSMLNIYCIGIGVGLEFDFMTYLVIVPPAILLTLVPISLAGWGVREGALIGLFTLLGADQSTILSLSVLYGLTLIVASLPGLQVYLAGKKVIK
ncbi:hypothetical protein MNBD_GAMMA22-2562 [hydrothermal vent metagenome]|uniref:Dolichol-P-glucose synthetase n=1 Tax=hydrothermal vent metagenome TaxID=652676 RepID=A0A3B1AMQ5_9ZZZZ